MSRVISVLILLFETLFVVSSYGQTPDYTSYAQLLSDCVDKNGLVNYVCIQNEKENLANFTSYIARYDSTEYSALPPESRTAFWINIYNALTLKLIADNYPIRPVWYKMPFLPRNSILMLPGAVRKSYFIVMGRSVTLGTIRDEILLKGFGDSRVDLALVSGSRGGPPLRAEPYTGTRLESQLDGQSSRFLSRRENLVVDRLKKKVHISKLFKKHGEDFVKRYLTSGPVKNFEPEDNAVLNFISQYVEYRDGLFIQTGDYEIKYLPFDWSLNEQ